jgi:RES domain-containing protein
MPTGWRIVKSKLAHQAFDGEGARLHGGRWNSRGTPLVYTSESVSLALLEVLVHIQDSRFLPSYSLCPVRFEATQLERLDRRLLPGSWRSFPAPPEVQALGDRWARSRSSLALEVPSAIVATERNFLLNPAHPDFPSLAIEPPVPFELDLRLLGP